MVDFHELTDRLERIYTPRLALRQAALADGWPLFAASRNTQFNEYLLWDQPESEWPVLDRVDTIVEAARRGKLTAVSAAERETGAWVSLFRFQPYAQAPRAVEMGVWTHHAFWRGTYTFELVSACIDVVFSFTDVDELIAAASPAHERSLRLLTRLGLNRQDRIVRRPCESGRMADFYEHRMTRETWSVLQDRRRFGVVEVPSLRAAASAQIKVDAPSVKASNVWSMPRAPLPARTTVEPLTIEVRSGSRPRSRLRQSERPEGTGLIQVDSAGD